MLGRDRFKRFWKVVDAVQWAARCEHFDLDLLRQETRFACEEMDLALDEAHTVLHELSQPIYNRIWRARAANPSNWGFVSDDGCSDMVDHIVGCGKAVFDAEAKNDSRLLKRHLARDFTEGFGYLFCPNEDEDALVTEGKSDQT